MKHTKKVIILLIVILSCWGITGLADSQPPQVHVDYNRDSQLVTIYGTSPVKSEDVTILILQLGKTEQDVNAVDPHSPGQVLRYIEQVTSDNTASFRHSFIMSDRSGAYIVRVLFPNNPTPAVATLNYFNTEDIKTGIEKINGIGINSANAVSQMQKTIEEYAFALDFNVELYTSLKTKNMNLSSAYEALIKAPDFKTVQEVREVFFKALLLIAFNESNDSTVIQSYLHTYDDLLHISDLDLYQVYSSFSSEEKLDVAALLNLGNYTSIEDVRHAFSEKVMVCSAFMDPTWNRMDEKLTTYSAVYGTSHRELLSLNLTGFHALTDPDKYNVFADMNGEKSTITSLADFVAKFNDRVTYYSNAVKNADQNTGTGNGSRSGGTSKVDVIGTIPGITPIPSITEFADLEQVSWAKQSIQALVEKGVVGGRSESIFDPLTNVTREEFIKILVGGFGLLYQNPEKTSFGDVQADEWYFNYIVSAEKSGIIKGDDSGNFGVGRQITREEMAVMIYRTLQLANANINTVNDKVVFADHELISPYAVESIEALQKCGVINGLGDGSFAPNISATRAEAATMIYKTLKMAGKL